MKPNPWHAGCAPLHSVDKWNFTFLHAFISSVEIGPLACMMKWLSTAVKLRVPLFCHHWLAVDNTGKTALFEPTAGSSGCITQIIVCLQEGKLLDCYRLWLTAPLHAAANISNSCVTWSAWSLVYCIAFTQACVFTKFLWCFGWLVWFLWTANNKSMSH